MSNDLSNQTFADFLATADLDTLRSKRAWLADYAGRTFSGHSEIRRNLDAYDAEIAKRESETTRYYQQATTGKLHARKNCSITARTRYSHFEVNLTDAEAANYEKCAKCVKPAAR